MKPLHKFFFNTAAYCCIGLGVLGIFLPLLPTTPFLLLAMFLLTRSNPRIAKWLNNNRYLGPYIRSYTKREKLPVKLKIRMILSSWLLMGLSGYFLTENLYVRLGLCVIALAVAIHIALLRTKSGVQNPKPSCQATQEICE